MDIIGIIDFALIGEEDRVWMNLKVNRFADIVTTNHLKTKIMVNVLKDIAVIVN